MVRNWHFRTHAVQQNYSTTSSARIRGEGTPPRQVAVLLAGIQAAKQAVRLVIRAGGEIKRVRSPSRAAVAEPDGPQPVDENRLPLAIAHLVNKLAALKIVGVDVAVAEVS